MFNHSCRKPLPLPHATIKSQTSRRKLRARARFTPDQNHVKKMASLVRLFFLCSFIVILYVCVCAVHISLSLQVGSVLNHCHSTLFSLYSKTRHISGNITIYLQIKLLYIRFTLQKKKDNFVSKHYC